MLMTDCIEISSRNSSLYTFRLVTSFSNLVIEVLVAVLQVIKVILFRNTVCHTEYV